MNMYRTSILSAAVLSLFAFACEKNPNAEVKSAQAELTSEQQQAQQDQARLQQKQSQERAEASQSGADRDDRAELQRKHDSERADTAADGRMATSSAAKGVGNAHENMAQDRRDVETKSKERLAKLDARATEMKTKSTKLDAKKKKEFETYFTRYQNERTAVNSRVSNLASTTDDNWQSAKKDLEQRIDLLESTLDKLEKDL